MSQQHVINGEEPVFDFDAFESPEVFSTGQTALAMAPDLTDMSHIPPFCKLELPSFSSVSTPAEIVEFLTRATQSFENRSIDGVKENADHDSNLPSPMSAKGKGKAASQPLDILPAREPSDAQLDNYFYSFTSSPAVGLQFIAGPSSSSSTPQTLASFAFSSSVASPSSLRSNGISTSYGTDITTPDSCFTPYSLDNDGNGDAEEEDASLTMGKGKARDDAPCLPPLSFISNEYARGETDWPAQEATTQEIPISRQISHSSSTVESPSQFSEADQLDRVSETPPLDHRAPSRSRSFSSLSTRSAKSVSASLSKLKLSFGKGKQPSFLARKLLLRNNDESTDSDGDIISDARSDVNVDMAKTVSSLPTSPGSNLRLGSSKKREKFRSYSLPITHTSQSEPAYNFGASSGDEEDLSFTDVQAQPCVLTNYFDVKLPKETKLSVFRALLTLHEIEERRMQASEDWTALKASKKENRWTGRNRGFIELVKLSRVSKIWQETVFDGQLWMDFDFHAFPMVPPLLLARLAASSGSFVKKINFTGHTRLTAASLVTTTNAFCISLDNRNFTTQLTDINLTGCTKLTTHSLHEIIIRSPQLKNLSLKGLPTVTNHTCTLMAKHCPSLESLDLSRCRNMDVIGLINLLSGQKDRRYLPLRVLRLAGLNRINDYAMTLLGSRAPLLEVLDLSNARELRDSALDALVSCANDGEDWEETILVSPRNLGRDPGDLTKLRRRVTKLRHLCLSSCSLLTDEACCNLAYSVPKLEFLELAGIGGELRDDGLVRLLSTTPLIRRLDLEEASDITDETIEVITPEIDPEDPDAIVGQPGYQLEQLTLSYAIGVTNDALSDLVKACPKLRCLEVDNTRITGTTVREFVRLCRSRGTEGAEIVVVDCRGVGESTVKDLADLTRTRKGWRGWDARRLNFLDKRDDEPLGVGQDECDEKRVVLKTFYSWQTVDAVEAARVKRRARKKALRDEDEGEFFFRKSSTSKWWSPGARRTSGSISPPFSGINDRDGCIIM